MKCTIFFLKRVLPLKWLFTLFVHKKVRFWCDFLSFFICLLRLMVAVLGNCTIGSILLWWKTNDIMIVILIVHYPYLHSSSMRVLTKSIICVPLVKCQINHFINYRQIDNIYLVGNIAVRCLSPSKRTHLLLSSQSDWWLPALFYTIPCTCILTRTHVSMHCWFNERRIEWKFRLAF